MVLSSVVDRILLHGSLEGMNRLNIESDEWISGRRNFIDHGLRVIPARPLSDRPAALFQDQRASPLPSSLSSNPPQRRYLGMMGRRT